MLSAITRRLRTASPSRNSKSCSRHQARTFSFVSSSPQKQETIRPSTPIVCSQQPRSVQIMHSAFDTFTPPRKKPPGPGPCDAPWPHPAPGSHAATAQDIRHRPQVRRTPGPALHGNEDAACAMPVAQCVAPPVCSYRTPHRPQHTSERPAYPTSRSHVSHSPQEYYEYIVHSRYPPGPPPARSARAVGGAWAGPYMRGKTGKLGTHLAPAAITPFTPPSRPVGPTVEGGLSRAEQGILDGATKRHRWPVSRTQSVTSCTDRF
jgi:hypothetical protein